MDGTTSLTPNTATDIFPPRLTGWMPGRSVGSTGTWAQSPCVSIMSAPPWPPFMIRTPTTSWCLSLSMSLKRALELTGLEAFTLMLAMDGIGKTHPLLITVVLQMGKVKQNQQNKTYFWNLIGMRSELCSKQGWQWLYVANSSSSSKL